MYNNRAVIEFPDGAVVVPGPHGEAIHIVADASALIEGFGREGDRAIIRTTGSEWLKEDGVWSETGDRFLGTLLPDTIAAKEAAEDAAEAANDDAVQTGLDRVATGLDRVQTGLDRVATGEDAQATALDRVATGADAQATAADRDQTGQDRVATGQDRTATGDDRQQTGQDRVATGEDRTATGDDRRQTGEDRTATGQDKQATAADRVETGLDRAATGGDALSTAADVAVANAAKDAAIAQEILVAALKAGVDTTYAAMITALANVTNYDNTLGQLTGAAKQIVAAADVVAAFVYDTAKDSDGGVWRWRARGSWFYEALNTATRGSRQFFPKRALIVARAASVTIYDLDDRACPMWMVINQANSASAAKNWWRVGRPASSAFMMNGFLYIGTDPGGTVGNGGLLTVDFIGDTLRRQATSASVEGGISAPGAIVLRNAGTDILAGTEGSTIVNRGVNAAAATVLPGTPIDPVRKLPNPTVAVATAGGVSVIHWDGRVANSGSPTARDKIWFAADGTLWFGLASGGDPLFSTPSEYAVTGFARHYYSAASTPPVPTSAMAGIISCGRNDIVRGGSFGLTRIIHEQGSGLSVDAQNNRSSIVQITSSFNTGYMVGAIRQALAESTADVTSLVGATPLFDDFSTYADTAALLAAWDNSSSLGAGAIALNAGRMALDRPTSGDAAVVRKFFTTVVGARYRISVDLVNATSCATRAGTTINNTDLLASQSMTPSATNVYSFVAKTTSSMVQFNATTIGATILLDNIRVDRVASDKSIAGNHPIIVGTITRAAVATGAELAAYSGWSTANYLDTPYSSAFDFGSFDFSMAMWANYAGGGLMFSRAAYSAGAFTGSRIHLTTSGGAPRFIVGDGTTLVTITSPTALTDSRPHLIVCCKRGSMGELWVDGVLVASASLATLGSLNNAAATLRYGCGQDGGAVYGAFTGSLTLMQPSATAPVPVQIRAKYAAELAMHQPGAKSLLTGSDNVQAVAYDEGTGLLYASNAVKGTDVISGLVRQSSITMASENALGPELIVGGDFSNPAQWVLTGAGTSISGGQLVITAVANGTDAAVPVTSANIVAGKTYFVEFDVVSQAAQGISILVGGTASAIYGTVGHPSFFITAGANGTIIVRTRNGTTTCTIDNLSVRELITQRLGSNNHKGVVATNDNIAIITDADVYVRTPSISLREAMDTAIGRAPTPAPYNRNLIERPSCAVTSNATPTVVASFPMDKGEAGDWVIETVSREYGDPAAQEFGLFRDHLYVQRPGEGNIALSGTSTQTIIRRVTATQAVTIQVNTTTQCIEVLATGVAAKSLEWGVKAVFFPVAQVA